MSLLGLLLLLGLQASSADAKFWTGLARKWDVSNFPNPRMEPERCGFSKDDMSRICDSDSILSQSARARVDEILISIEDEVPADMCSDKPGMLFGRPDDFSKGVDLEIPDGGGLISPPCVLQATKSGSPS